MVYEQFSSDQERFWGWRCIFCGEIVDSVILENRRWLKMGVGSDNKETRDMIGKRKPLTN